MEAKTILSKSQTVAARAEDFFKRIKRNIQKETIDVLEEKIEKINDKIIETKDFSLDTDLNKGQKALTMSECQERFNTLIELEYEKELLERELAIKQASFSKYFEESKSEE